MRGVGATNCGHDYCAKEGFMLHRDRLDESSGVTCINIPRVSVFSNSDFE